MSRYGDDDTLTGFDQSRSGKRNGAEERRIGTFLAERFLLKDILGSGATGTVFAAVDSKVGQRVAVKLLHPDLRDSRTRERLRREVRASRPPHPNIVSVFDLHDADGDVFLSMELVEGHSLRSVLKNKEDLSVDQVITIGRHIAAALKHLHERGLVHRDVKPGNILLGADGTVKLCDMGLVRHLEEGVTVTQAEMVVGTPDYMAPEQASGKELCAASDIYGLGLTLFKALVGEVPMKESTAIATLSRRQRERPPSIRTQRSDCPRWFDRLIRRMLEPEPGERPTIPEVLRALKNRRLFPRLRRKTLASAAAVLVLAVVGIPAGLSLKDRPAARVEVGRTDIVGRDDHGDVVWKRTFDLPVQIERRADLDGDGVEEIVVVAVEDDKDSSRRKGNDGPEIWIFDSSGHVVTHFIPEDVIKWNFEYDVEIDTRISLVDIEHNGLPEVVLVASHCNFFPAVVFIYRSGSDQWLPVMIHSGHILGVTSTPEDSPPGLRFIAVNNRLGVLGFVGEILVKKSALLDVRSSYESTGLASPPFGTMGVSSEFQWRAYVPMPMDSGRFLSGKTLVRNDDEGGLQLTVPDGDVLRYDRFWNLTPGPNAGIDRVELRREFMDELYLFMPRSQIPSVPVFAGRRAAMLQRFKPLLEEESYRLILDLKSSRALARAGNLEQALEILGRTARTTGQPDALYRYAHFLALSGRLEEAQALLLRMIHAPEVKEFGTRAFFDGPHLILRIGISTHDVSVVDEVIEWLSALGKDTGKVRVAQALRARTHLWWDQLEPEDLEVGSWAYAPGGEAVACLARWRHRQTRADDVSAMDTFFDLNPEAIFEGRLARATALLGVSRNAEALDELNLLIELLEFPSKDDFSNYQILDLTRAVRVVALEADGQDDRARTEAAELLPRLTPGLLPAILVEEVLSR